MALKNLIVLGLVQWALTIAGAQNTEALSNPVQGDGVAKPVQSDEVAKAETQPVQVNEVAKPVQGDEVAKAKTKPVQGDDVATTDETMIESTTDNLAEDDTDAEDAQTALSAEEEHKAQADSVQQAFMEMDANQDGSLSLDEFAGLITEDMSAAEVEQTRTEVKYQFSELDKDNSGGLSKEEFQKAEEPEKEQIEEDQLEDPEAQMTAFGEETSMQQDTEEQMDSWQAGMKMVETSDKDKDGELSFEEFAAEQSVMFDEDEEEDKEELMKELKIEFNNADTNKDDKLSPDELQAFTKGDDEEPASK